MSRPNHIDDCGCSTCLRLEIARLTAEVARLLARVKALEERVRAEMRIRQTYLSPSQLDAYWSEVIAARAAAPLPEEG